MSTTEEIKQTTTIEIDLQTWKGFRDLVRRIARRNDNEDRRDRALFPGALDLLAERRGNRITNTITDLLGFHEEAVSKYGLVAATPAWQVLRELVELVREENQKAQREADTAYLRAANLL